MRRWFRSYGGHALFLLAHLVGSTPALADEPAPKAAVDDDASAAATPSASSRAAGTSATEPGAARARPDVAEVRVIGDGSAGLPKVPGSGMVIGSKAIERAQPVDTAEMLRRVPGVQVRQEYGAGNRIDISIRGLEGGRSRRVLLLEDGMPMSLNPYSEPDMNYGPVIERYRGIEVVKGSGNILFGPQTLAGTINFLTLEPPSTTTVAADVDAGNFGYVRGLARYGDTIGQDGRFIVQVLRRQGDGFRALPFESTDVLAKFASSVGERGNFTLKLGYHNDDVASDDVGLTAPMYRANPRRPSFSPKSHLVLGRYDVSLTHQHRFDDAWTLKTLLYAYRTDRIWRRQDYTRQPVAGEGYASIVGDVNVPLGAIYFKPTNSVLDRTYDVMGVEPRAEARLKTGSVRHTMEFGARLLHETADYEQRAGEYVETYAGALELKERHRGTAAAGYVQDRIAFTDKLLVVPGIRVEYLSFRRAILRRGVAGNARDVYDEATSDVNAIIPGIGLVYGTRSFHAFGGLHRGFAPPRVTSAISPLGERAQVGADESTNYELGARFAPTRWSELHAAGFLSVFRNQVVADTSAGADVILTDAGGTQLAGVETSALMSLGKALRWPTEVSVGARYTFSRSTFRFAPNAGNLLPYAPEHALNTNLDVEHPTGFGGQVAYAFVDRQFTDAANTELEDITGRFGVLEARHLVDATIHYRHRQTGLTFRLTAKNLLDSTYVIARRPEGIHPGGFRQVLVGVRWEWEAKPK